MRAFGARFLYMRSSLPICVHLRSAFLLCVLCVSVVNLSSLLTSSLLLPCPRPAKTVRWLTLRPPRTPYHPPMPHLPLILAGAIFVVVIILALTYRGT